MTNDRKLYYFHIQHDRCEMGKDCPPGCVNADEEWQAIEETLESLPTPHKMYNDSFLFKSGSPRDEAIVSSKELICAFTLQPYLSDDERKLLQAQAHIGADVRQDEQTTFLQQLMGHFATLPYFSNNDRVLLKLASRGTNLVACESQALRLDFEKSRASLEASFGSAHDTQDACNLLGVVFQRNEFIAGQIALSLKPGETGVLFLGHLHGTDSDMVKRLKSWGILVEEKNECQALERLKNLFGCSDLPSGFAK